ncbi:MAG: hypothetical protein DYG89_23250 [Caldilinea sp. CFX5]|nr:hypothetical protein [Caldilinea sp. CFX5]
MDHRKSFLAFSLILVTLLVVAASRATIFSKSLLTDQFTGVFNPTSLTAAYQKLRQEHEAEQLLQRAWLLAQQAGAYDFHTEIEQTTYHAPALTNVGRPAQVDSLYLEGKNDTKAKNFQVAIWQGGSILERSRAYEVRTDGEQSYGRAAGEEWQPIDDISAVFAPNRDPLAYLHGVKHVREVALASNSFRQFQFDLDGPTFAQYIRSQLEEQLRQAGKLPPGITLDTPHTYQGMVGTGEIWLSKVGLPEQLNFTLNFPQQSDGSRVHAVLHTDFANFDTSQLAHATAPFGGALPKLPLWLANQLGRLTLVEWPQVGMHFALLMVLGLGAALIVRFGHKPNVYAALTVAIIVSQVCVPLLQSTQAAAFDQEQVAAQQAMKATEAQAAQQLAAQAVTWDPSRPPLAAAPMSAVANTLAVQPDRLLYPAQSAASVPAAQTTTTAAPDTDNDGVPDRAEPPRCINTPDCDGDGLTDLQEARLGTKLDDPDSDGDKVRDDLEVKGFTLGGRQWYSNPNNVDTNKDGLPDTLECWRENTPLDLAAPSNLPCNRDSDNDLVPDLFAYDNDGDGVDDSTDLSPFLQTTQVYTQNSPFTFQSNGLTPNEPLFVDFQLTPISRTQLSYAHNVLDWPTNDSKGQVVRTKETTFATGKSAGSYSPSEENGDLRLVPVVEIKIPAADANKLFPTTSVLTVTRSGIGYTPITATSSITSLIQAWLTATVELRGDAGTTTVAFPTLTGKANAAITVDSVKIFQSTCPQVGSTPPVSTTTAADPAAPKLVMETTSVTANGAPWSLGALALPDLLDGNHVMLFGQGRGAERRTLCLPLGDVANGALPGGQMFATAHLAAYGITLRDELDGQGRPTQVIAYLPAHVVTGQTRGEKQAFSARMAYWPAAGVTSLGAAQEVRLVWMVQLLGDDGNIQIVHVYANEGWRLAGLSARQDIAMRSAVIYQDPDNANNANADVKAIHAQLWTAVSVLDSDFASGKHNRLPLNQALIPTLENQNYIPPGSLRAEVNTYETQDEIVRVAAEVTPGILNRFIHDGSYKAGYDHVLLLFAREEEYKTALWDGGNTLALPATASVLASYSWKPFRYENSRWEAFPAAQYLDLLRVRLQTAADQADILQQAKDTAERTAIRDGIALANQAFAMGMLFGANRIVALDNSPLPSMSTENLLPTKLKEATEKVVGAKLQIIASEITEDLAQELLTKSMVNKFEFASQEVLDAVNSRTRLAILGDVLQGRVTKFKSAFGSSDLQTRVSAAGLSIAVVSIGLMIGKLATSNETAGKVIDSTLASLAAVSSALTLTAEGTKVASAVKGAGGLVQAMKTAQPLSRAVKIAAVVGLVLVAAIAVGSFIAQWAAGAFNITDLGFTAALSGVIATIIVAVIMLAIGFIPIVGPIIVAVIALIDGVIAAACAITKAAGFDLETATTLNIPRTGGAKLSFCAGLTGLATEAVRFLLFSQTVLVGNMQAKDRLTTSNFQLNLQHPDQGFQVGNEIAPTLRVDNKITLVDQPFDWKSLVYFWQLNWDNLDSATHRYDLTIGQSKRSVDRAEMESEWQELQDGVLTGSHRSPGIQYDDPLVMAPTVARLAAGTVITWSGGAVTATIPFTEAGLNLPLPLYLREAYANPAQECWTIPLPPVTPIPAVPVCFIRSDAGTNHIDLQLTYDIFPAALTEFYAGVQVDKGASLAWGQRGDVKFPVMKDFDGDGLRSPAHDGNDPDDRYWDTDGDGLSDLFETQQGTQASTGDSDNDGLRDRVELLVGSNPRQSDSDGDGLLDGQEIFHQDQEGNWVGGWEFVYDIVNGVPQKTWVTSDPLLWNSDGDSFTDAQEQRYGLHPRVPSDPAILKLQSQLSETNAPVTLLRFEERSGARSFADASGLLNNAICADDASCPQAGHEGRYTNGLVFDGQDDVVKIHQASSLANHSFTIAIWAKRNVPNPLSPLFFGGVSAFPAVGLLFNYENHFTCATHNSILRSPEAYTDTEWHHWACTYDMAQNLRTIYRDGVVLAQDSPLPPELTHQSVNDWWIGSDFSDSTNKAAYFSGTLDELVVAPTALDNSHIGALMEARYNSGGARLLVAPNDSLTYEATVENNLLGKALTGLLEVDAPKGWGNDKRLTDYQLRPSQAQPLSGTITVFGDLSGAYSVTLTANAAATDVNPQPLVTQTGPVAYFTFDNPSDRLNYAPDRPSATQSLGTQNTEKGVGTGQALVLDGRTVIEAEELRFGIVDTPFTYALWVKPDTDANGIRAIFGQPPTGRKWQYTDAGIFLRVQDGRNLLFGWGEAWNTGFIANAVTPGVWNHIAVTFDNTDVTIYVNGVPIKRMTPANSRPQRITTLTIGDDNYCGEFELKNVHTIEEGDPLESDAEYVYVFVDESLTESRLLYDDNADSGDWEPGDGPAKEDIFPQEGYEDMKRTFCRTGSRVYVYEDDISSDDGMLPDLKLDLTTPDHSGYSKDNYASYGSGELSGDGKVEFFYEIHNPVLPFKGSIDEMRFYYRALSDEEVQQLHDTVTLPYHYTLDDPPSASLDNSRFNFTNEGAVADPGVSGYCSQGACPISGVTGRVNRAVSFDGNEVIQIDNLTLPAATPGLALWVNPAEDGQIMTFSDNNFGFRLFWAEGKFCILSACSAASFPAGKWAHVMVNFDDSGANLYVNGVKAAADNSLPWPGAGTYTLHLGDGFTGRLDDLRILDDGRNVIAPLNAAPLVLLPFDETDAGITAFENAGGSSATCNGNTCPHSGRVGKLGPAVAFDGVDDGLTIADSDALDLNTFTLAAWVKPTAGTNANSKQPIIAKSEGDYRNYALYMTSDRKIYVTRHCTENVFVELYSKNILPLDQYAHVAATYDGKNLAIYINGVLDNTVQGTTANACHNAAPLTIGVPYNANTAYVHYSGILDEVLVYPNALWGYQIKDLYDSQSNWIEEEDAHEVTVDALAPTSSLTATLPLATNYYANADVQLGVNTADATSEVTLLEVGVSLNDAPTIWRAAQPCQDAARGDASSPAWCPWFKPTQWGGEGRYQLQTRATDAVGNREIPTASYVIVVDSTAPTLTATQTGLQNLTRHPTNATAQILHLDGTVSDAGSGVHQVWVTLRDGQGNVVGDAPYPATLNGETWSLPYPFHQAQVAGAYTLEVVAEDQLKHKSSLPARTLVLDGAAPTMTLDEFASGLPITQTAFPLLKQGASLQGWLSDYPLPPGVRFAYPFEESSGATTFANLVATSGWLTASVATCAGNSCPNAVDWAPDGYGLAFDGGDDAIRLPRDVAHSADFTFAALVYWQGGEAMQRIFDFGQDTNNHLFLTPSDNEEKVNFLITQNGAPQGLQLATALPANAWVYVAVVLEGETGRLYLDGVEATSGPITFNPNQVVGNSNWLGRSQYDGDPHFKGVIDQVAIYHRALRGDEIRLLAATQVAGVETGSLAFTPLWAVARDAIPSPYSSARLAGQVLYLPLDEPSHPDIATTTYRNLADENAAPATCADSHCPEPHGDSPAGGATDFDGQDDYLTLPADVASSADFSFAAWVYWRGGQAMQRIFDFGQDTTNHLFLTPSDNEGKVNFLITQNGTPQGLAAATALPANRWVHVAVVLEGETGRLYLDGIEATSGPITFNPNQAVASNHWLGRSQYVQDPYFNGRMDDVRIFARGLSAAEIRSLWLGNRALLSLPLDEPVLINGDTLTDESGWHQPVTLHSGADDVNNKAAPGQQGPYALNFDGVDDYVDLSAAVAQGDDFTFAAWVYWRGGQPWQRIFDFGTDTTHNIYFTPTGKDNTLYFNTLQQGIPDTWLETAYSLPTNQWVHVAVTLQGDTGRLYLYGTEATSGPITLNPSQITGGAFWLGRSHFPNDPYFNGLMDDVRIYAHALNAAEIADLANMGWRQAVISDSQHWQAGVLGQGNRWRLNVPDGLEGVYRVDLRSKDQGAHTAYNPLLPAINQTIDTHAPRATLTKTVEGGQTRYTFHAADLFLTQDGLITPCGAEGQVQPVYRWDNNRQADKHLAELTVTCTLNQAPAGEEASVCDLAGNCTRVAPPSAQAQGDATASAQPGETRVASAAVQPATLDTWQGAVRLPSYRAPALFSPPVQQPILPGANLQHPSAFAQLRLSWSGSATRSKLAQDNAIIITESVDTTSGLVLHWSFEEGPGNCTVQDQTTNAISGTLANMDCTAAWSTDIPANSPQFYSLHFGSVDGDDALSSAISERLPASNSPRTLCAWAKSSDGSVNGWAEHVVNYGTAANNQAFGFMLYAGNAWHLYRHDGDISTAVPADTNWHHHCLAHDGALLTYYLNGAVVASVATTFATTPNTPLVVGSRPDLVNNTAFDGWVDDVRLYDRALTADEVQSLYTFAGQWIEIVEGNEPAPDNSPPAVDSTPPMAVLASNLYTANAYSLVGGLIFSGDLSHATGVISATASLALGNESYALITHLHPISEPIGYVGGNAVYTSAPWAAIWQPPTAGNPPDLTTGTLSLTLYDASLKATTTDFSVTLDLQAPNVGEPTLLAGGIPLVANATYSDTTLATTVTLAPTTDAGGVSLWYGWTDQIVAPLAALTQAPDPAAGVQLKQAFTRSAADGPSIYYFHVLAQDGLGNTTRQVYGPYYHDLPGMPDQITPPQPHGDALPTPYREWVTNGCTLLGSDRRLAGRGAESNGAQSLYLSWDGSFFHWLWEGADWETDGDLFIYLDTIAGQGSLGAYNPYASTAQRTLLLLPAREEPGTLAINTMQADFALWVTDSTTAYLLRWDGSTWVNDGPLASLGGAYAFSHEHDGKFSDLVLPFALVGSPTTTIDVVALAVDGEEGPSAGLRLWSVLPYANPVDSTAVVPSAPAADQPHRLLLTDRYTIPLAAGTCLTPESDLRFYLSTAHDGLYYDGTADAVRLILPEPAVNPNPWDALFDPYDDVYQRWLAENYCPTDPTFPDCRAADKPAAPLSTAERLALNGLTDGFHPPLSSGSPVTYTLHFQNPTAEAVTLPAYLYTNNDLNNPQNGIRFADQSWVDGCPGWLALTLPPGVGTRALTGVVQSGGVQTVTLDIAPTYTQSSCAVTGNTTDRPRFRLQVEHTPDDGAPGYVAIAADFTTSSPISATIQGLVRDASAVPAIEIEVNGANSFACVDDSPLDGQWRCVWDVIASNGGVAPDNGARFTIRARATDSYGQQSDWSAPRTVVIDAQAPQLGAPTDSTPLLVANAVLQLNGLLTDSARPESVEVCDSNAETCRLADLTIDPFSIPQSVYGYTDQPGEPLPIEQSGVCADGGVGLVRRIDIGDSFTIAALNVGLRLAHPYRSDLSASLTSPAGTQVTLFAFERNVLAENVNARFTDLGTALLADDRNSHDLASLYTHNSYQPRQSLAAFAGQDAVGAWTLTLCDRDPASDSGAFYDAALHFTAVAPPRTITGHWSTNEDVSANDGVLHTWQIFASDEHGQRTNAPVELSVMVDNVAPVLTVTQSMTEALVNSSQPVLRGSVSDGDTVENIWVLVTDPLGRMTAETVTGPVSDWTYHLMPAISGEYRFAIYAADRAGNQTVVQDFALTAK